VLHAARENIAHTEAPRASDDEICNFRKKNVANERLTCGFASASFRHANRGLRLADASFRIVDKELMRHSSFCRARFLAVH
jgi:hypothetical protein